MDISAPIVSEIKEYQSLAVNTHVTYCKFGLTCLIVRLSG